MKNFYKNVLITGVSGFVGTALNQRLQQEGFCCTGTSRKEYGSIENADFSSALFDVEVVVHTAARVHISKENSSDPLSAYRLINVAGTLNLARQAATAGVKRFIFISSIGVNGATTYGKAFSEADKPAPHSLYAISKYEAEEELSKFCQESQMELVIIRPPLIYASHAPGNFARLIKLVKSGLPLPFGSINNKRSYISIDNLTDFICLCTNHPMAANELFLVSDDEKLSTKDLARIIANKMDKKPLLIPVPISIMKLGAMILGKKSLFEQLCSSLEIDNSKAKKILNWTPPHSMTSSLK